MLGMMIDCILAVIRGHEMALKFVSNGRGYIGITP